jgi:CRISPR-associated endonuclease/helicase Cas3
VSIRNYEDFFRVAYDAQSSEPFPYQERIAEATDLPLLLNVPTGAGKTAAVILGWLWRRRFAAEEVRLKTPRRLAYCLPMRVLVEQTVDACSIWLKNLELEGSEGVALHAMLGGDFDDDWDLYPEVDAILVGTQDMLLSRALNRGYGTTRYRWPTQFGLLNRDTLWVFDETQLMGVGLKTSAQLQAFRQRHVVGIPAHTIWMSATLNERSLETVDTRTQLPAPWAKITLEEDDFGDKRLSTRLSASKRLLKADMTLNANTRNDYPKLLAELAASMTSERGGQTIVVVNRVDRAQETFQALKKQDPKGEILLLHSRYRGAERAHLADQLRKRPEAHQRRIVIATQAIEAGVDITSRTLVTELAPWDSLVQRFGRCNRYGEEEEAQVIWVDLSTTDEKGKQTKDLLPYSGEQLEAARALLVGCTDVGLKGIAGKHDGLSEPVYHVIRHRDLIDLFDTTPDLAGADVDVSRFIRDSESMDVQVYWRRVEGKHPQQDANAPSRDELCAVPIVGFREFVKKREKDGSFFWTWDYVAGRWQPLRSDQVRPGMVVLADTRAGGYEADIGWISTSKMVVTPVAKQACAENQGNADDPGSHIGRFVTLSAHHNDVVSEIEAIVTELRFPVGMQQTLVRAARLHDWGKAHPDFQAMLTERKEDEPSVVGEGPWAKSDRKKFLRSKLLRPQFRHELASALAALSAGEEDLVCYLIAAHHGKVRLSIRSMPGERIPENGGRFARGIWDGDSLPAVQLGDEVSMPEMILDLQPMELGRSPDGRPSWLERMLNLRNTLGPFQLAYLESLIRAADRRASAKEAPQ